MVDEFRNYARTPDIKFANVDLNALVDEVLTLYESGQNKSYQIHTELCPDLPMIWADAQQLRQVLHNLIKNAIEAHPVSTDGIAKGELSIIHIQTELNTLQADNLVSGQAIKLTITDNGTGFSEAVMARMFEPYNSSKPHGTGLGLPIIKKILDAHHAPIRIKNIVEKNSPHKILGAQIGILFVGLVHEERNISTTQLL